MKNQVKSPIQILVEMLVLIFVNSIKFLIVIGQLLLELYLSLKIMAYSNPMGFIFAVAVGGVIIFFTLKYVFGSTISAIKIIAIYVIIVALLTTIFGEKIDISEIALNSTP